MKKYLFVLIFLMLMSTVFPFYFENDIEYKIFIYDKLLNGEVLETSITPYPDKSKNEIKINIPYYYTNKYELIPLFQIKNKDYSFKFSFTTNYQLNFQIYFGKKINSFWFIIGRYKTDWSLLERGVFLSDSLPYVDGITGGFTTDFLFGDMGIYFGAYAFNSYLTDEEKEIQKMQIDGNSDRRSINMGYYEPYKTLLIHRLDLRPTDFLRISFNELNLIGGKFPDLVDLNFMNVLHNTYGEGYSNAMLAIDGEIIPLKGIKLYGEIAMDDFVVPLTESGAEDYKPTAFAWGYGFQYVFKVFNGYLNTKIEDYKIYSWMYNRWQELLKFTGRYIENNKIYDIPMGYDYGSGIESQLFSIEYIKNKFNIKLIFEKVVQGEINLSTSYFDKTLKGNIETWEGPYGNINEIYYTTLDLKLNNLLFNMKLSNSNIIEYMINYEISF
ncbi:hypothetical protein X275_07260 [Marinitoga sp. 1197]|uniref:hypothetical protein n=1 Tax=Marinitoga sp. 1197 TaxID=1428449 RepID=UPI0006417570|nr:hypothetical protein [Marinitoga sp. 1197]KLO22118.1 hypothetical protein X275_07260 [Marinitoga sp. 1197]